MILYCLYITLLVGSEMAKYDLRLRARKLRQQGVSVRDIAIQLDVAKSSVSWWVRDIALTQIQKARLTTSEIKGRERGLFKTMQIKRERRASYLEEFNISGALRMSAVSKNELFVLGVGLYWAEGGKSDKNRRVEFCNSDLGMIKFFILWLEVCFGVPKEDLRCVLGINQVHELREDQVRKYWSERTGIPLDQFRKTSFKKVKNYKVYDNFNEHFGTLTVLVAKSTNLYYEIMGLIKGLMQTKIIAG